MFINHLISVPHNLRYLHRYVDLIAPYIGKNKIKGKTEMHHICPVSIFPEFKNLKKFPWNKVHLPSRVHYVAHMILCKVYNNDKLHFAFWAMSHQKNNFQNRCHKVNSIAYARSKESVVNSLSQQRIGKPASQETKAKLQKAHGTIAARLANSYRQQSQHIKDKFSMENEIALILGIASESWNIPYIIAKTLGIKEGFVKSVMRTHELEIVQNQTVTKVYNNYRDKFTSYENYVTSILELHNNNICPTQISKILKINEHGVLKVLETNKISPHKGIPGMPKGSKRLNPQVSKGLRWYHHQETGKSGRFIECPPGWAIGRILVTRSSTTIY